MKIIIHRYNTNSITSIVKHGCYAFILVLFQVSCSGNIYKLGMDEREKIPSNSDSVTDESENKTEPFVLFAMINTLRITPYFS